MYNLIQMKMRDMKKSRKIIFLIFGILLISVSIYLLSVFRDLPDIAEMPDNFFKPSIEITDRTGVVLYEAITDDDGGYQNDLTFEQLPTCIVDATLAIEDKNFYANPGIDIQGMVRAVWINLQGSDTLAGGSTITQQVAHNLLLRDEFFERTVRRKLREIVLALQLNQVYTKDEILTIYLNQIYYGGLSYGVEAASQIYFERPVSELNLAECALLAGLPQAPSFYNPLENPTSAKLRQEDVLAAMLDQGKITQEEHDKAVEFKLEYSRTPYPILAPHFVEMVVEHVEDLVEAGELVDTGGLVVRTTLDYSLQQQAEKVIQRNIAAYMEEGGIAKNVNNAALVALEPQTGEILAMVGSVDFEDEEIEGKINMAIEKRQPGSAFKPIIYAAALDAHGPDAWNAATTILDVTTTFVFPSGEAYTPLNYDYREHGPVPVRVALGSSLNIPAVKTLDHVGLDEVFDLAAELGISASENLPGYNLSYALGGGDMTLLELTGAYTAFANSGNFVPNEMILEIRNIQGVVVYKPEEVLPEQVFSEEVAWLISDILSDDEARSIGFGANSILNLDRPAAVKTGTTSNYHDNWTIGYTPEIVVGVWVGNSDYKSMRNVTGLTGAGPIWHDFMRTALANTPETWFYRPNDLVALEVCTLSGLLPTEACQVTHTEWFIPGTEPNEPDNVYQQIEVDMLTGMLANANTPSERIQERMVLDLPTEAQRWANAQGFSLLSEFQAGSESEQESAGSLLQIISPAPNTSYQISPNYAIETQQLLIEVAAGAPFSQVNYYVDGVLLTTLYEQPYEYWWQLAEGEHTFWVAGITQEGVLVSSERLMITVFAPED